MESTCVNLFVKGRIRMQ